METSVRKIILVLLAVLSVSACSKKSDSRQARDPGVGTGLGVPPVTTSACNAGQQTTGRIYEDASNPLINTSLSFEERVKGLLSAKEDPQFFGTISGNGNDPQNGVTLEGRLRYDGHGAVLLDQSSVNIVIHDSLVGQLDSQNIPIKAYPIYFSAASSGTVNLQTNTFTLQFKDAYGEITLDGTIASTTVTGTISYRNYQNATGGALAAGVLGAFSIATCAWIN